MKLWMSLRERELFTSCWTGTSLGGVSRQNIIKDKMLAGQPAYENVVGSYQYSETGLKIDFGS